MTNIAVEYEVTDGVAVLTLNRPEALNSLTAATWKGLVEGLERANGDPSISAVVLTGRGNVFCAGGDLQDEFLPKMRGDVPYDDSDHRLGGLGMPWDWISILRQSKPVLAAVNGPAVGGGATSILPCDVIVASEAASFHFMFAKLGLVPELGSSHYLARRVGFTQASEILLSARTVDAAEALEIGLVNAVVPADELMDKAMAYARAIASNPQPMVRMIKELLDQNIGETDVDLIWRRESDALRECFTLPEHREAVTAFLEKRAPDFQAARAASDKE